MLGAQASRHLRWKVTLFIPHLYYQPDSTGDLASDSSNARLLPVAEVHLDREPSHAARHLLLLLSRHQEHAATVSVWMRLPGGLRILLGKKRTSMSASPLRPSLCTTQYHIKGHNPTWSHAHASQCSCDIFKQSFGLNERLLSHIHTFGSHASAGLHDPASQPQRAVRPLAKMPAPELAS